MEITNPGAHVDQLLWQTRWHHVQLISMADVKSNMLLTMASVIITLSIRYVTDPRLRWPAIVLMIFCGNISRIILYQLIRITGFSNKDFIKFINALNRLNLFSMYIFPIV